jgi:L-aminoadipate-semialdehyde dehydrogenase
MIPSYDVEKVRDEIFSELKLRKTELGGFCDKWFGTGSSIEKRSPIDGTLLGEVRPVTDDEYEQIIVAAQNAYTSWRTVPAPKRGEVVRQFGERLRQLKTPLGRLVSLETGKILAEGEGEVQEMIDICDFATGLSRQLYGLTIPSERSGHRMLEQWHPLGVVGIISAFNFPVAVWSWNAALAARPDFSDLFNGCARNRALPRCDRERLWRCQRQRGHERSRDWRCFRRGERDRWRP